MAASWSTPRALIVAGCLASTLSAPAIAQTDPVDPTIAKALDWLSLPRDSWPLVELTTPNQFPDAEREAAFRIRRGWTVDPHIYVNPRHKIFREAQAAGTSLYPVLRLASVLVHEMQHAEREQHSELDALRVQAAFLRQRMPLLPDHQRIAARRYVQAIETGIGKLQAQAETRALSARSVVPPARERAKSLSPSAKQAP